MSKPNRSIPSSAVGAGFACPKTQSKLFSGEQTSPLQTKQYLITLLFHSVPTNALIFHQSNHSVPVIASISRSALLHSRFHYKGQILYLLSPVPVLIFPFQPLVLLPFLESHTAFIIQPYTCRFLLFRLLGFLLTLLFHFAPISIIRIVAGEITNITLSFEYQ